VCYVVKSLGVCYQKECVWSVARCDSLTPLGTQNLYILVRQVDGGAGTVSSSEIFYVYVEDTRHECNRYTLVPFGVACATTGTVLDLKLFNP
jgi:hypothetical protein